MSYLAACAPIQPEIKAGCGGKCPPRPHLEMFDLSEHLDSPANINRLLANLIAIGGYVDRLEIALGCQDGGSDEP